MIDLSDDFIWNPLSSRIHATKLSPSHFVNINCPMCVSRGESADTKKRCGIKRDASGIGIHCFNCGFKARFRVGQRLRKNMAEFLRTIGVPEIDVQRINHSAFVLSRMAQQQQQHVCLPPTQAYDGPIIGHSLPKSALPISTWAEEGCDDPDFLNACDYLMSRGDAVFNATTYFWSPETENGLNNRIIVPVYYLGEIVGWTARSTRGQDPKYLTHLPRDVMLNPHAVLSPERKIIIAVEGVFDALAIDALGLLGSNLNEARIAWLNAATDKRKIILPDPDKAGQKLIDVALRNGWEVSFPMLSGHWWEADVKDAAEASRRYGKLWTLRSIIAASVSSNTKIRMLRQKIS